MTNKENFDTAMRRILSVSKVELQRRLDEEKKRPRIGKKGKNILAAHVALRFAETQMRLCRAVLVAIIAIIAGNKMSAQSNLAAHCMMDKFVVSDVVVSEYVRVFDDANYVYRRQPLHKIRYLKSCEAMVEPNLRIRGNFRSKNQHGRLCGGIYFGELRRVGGKCPNVDCLTVPGIIRRSLPHISNIYYRDRSNIWIYNSSVWFKSGNGWDIRHIRNEARLWNDVRAQLPLGGNAPMAYLEKKQDESAGGYESVDRRHPNDHPFRFEHPRMWRLAGGLASLLAYFMFIYVAIRISFDKCRYWYIPLALLAIFLAALGGGMMVFGQPWPTP